MKNAFQPIWFALSVSLMTACHTHQPLSVDNHEPPLIAAARNDDHNAVNSLLPHSVDPNLEDTYGKTALMVAAENGHVASVSVLLRHGADPNHKITTTRQP